MGVNLSLTIMGDKFAVEKPALSLLGGLHKMVNNHNHKMNL